MEPVLNKYFYDISERTSFRNARIIHNYLRQQNEAITFNEVKEYLKSQLTHLIFKPVKKKFDRNPIVSKYIDHLWNLDLVELNYPEENDDLQIPSNSYR